MGRRQPHELRVIGLWARSTVRCTVDTAVREMLFTGGGLVIETLRRFGLRYLFSLPGHQTLSVFDACLDGEPKLISVRHEASAVFMAQALAIATHDVAVALLAGGPELTNALTAIGQAYYSHTPLVVIAGSNTMQKRDRGFPQDMDQLSLVRPLTKWARSCHAANRIPEYIAMAYRNAVRGRPGPTYLEIPYDVLETRVRVDPTSLPSKPERIAPGPPPEAVEELRVRLSRAERPVVIAGGGTLWSGAEVELQRFAERTGIPLLPTAHALALHLPSELVFGFGTPGLDGNSIHALGAADLVLLLGTEVNFSLGFGQEPFMPSRQTVIQVDVLPEEIDTNRKIDLGVAADVTSTLQALNRGSVRTRSLQPWRDELRDRAAAFNRELDSITGSSSSPMHPMKLVEAVEAVREEGSYLILDGANSVLWALLGEQRYRKGGVIVSSSGQLEAIGAGVAQAIGIKLAEPRRQVILLTGDGSVGYGVMEFATAIRHGVNFLTVVHNDGGWGMTRDMQARYFGATREIGNVLGTVRYDRVMSALGGHGEFVESTSEIDSCLAKSLTSAVPACVNAMVDPRPQSPGLQTYMLLETMLGKKTAYDQMPGVFRQLRRANLDRPASRLARRRLEATLQSRMGTNGW